MEQSLEQAGAEANVFACMALAVYPSNYWQAR
jgi:hypothetical protein